VLGTGRVGVDRHKSGSLGVGGLRCEAIAALHSGNHSRAMPDNGCQYVHEPLDVRPEMIVAYVISL
jgi:hypothetical protein